MMANARSIVLASKTSFTASRTSFTLFKARRCATANSRSNVCTTATHVEYVAEVKYNYFNEYVLERGRANKYCVI